MARTYTRRLRHVPAPTRGTIGQPTVIARTFAEPQLDDDTQPVPVVEGVQLDGTSADAAPGADGQDMDAAQDGGDAT